MSLITLNRKVTDMIAKINRLSSAPNYDTSRITDWSYFFYNNSRLEMVPFIDTCNATDLSRMFSNCSQLTQVPVLNTEKATNFSYMFTTCSALTTVAGIDTSNATLMANMFNGCSALTQLEHIDLSGCTQLAAATNLFLNCKSLRTVKRLTFSEKTVVSANMFSGCTMLENIGFEGKIKVTNSNLKLNASPKLSADTLASLIRALQDNTGGTTYTITLGAENLAKLTAEQKQEITDKNFNLA